MGYLALVAALAAAAAQADQAAPAPPPDPAASEPAKSSAVEGITVEAQKPIKGDLMHNVITLQPSFFTKVRPSTAMDMVQWLPGFSFQDTRDVRGLEGSGGNVLIDGKPPTSKTDTLQSVLRRIPAEQIERIDIISGGAPGIDMHGWPVIANVILKKDANKRRTITLANTLDIDGHEAPGGSFNSSDKDDKRTVELSLDAGRGLNQSPVIGEGTWRRTDVAGNVIFDANPRSYYPNPYAVGSGAYDKALWGGRLRFNGSGRWYGSNYMEQDRLRYGPEGQGFSHTQTYEQGELGAAYEHPLGKQLTTETQLLERLTHYVADNTLNRPPQPSFLDKHQDESETVARTTLRYKPADAFSLEGAAEGALNAATTSSRETLSGQTLTLPESNVNLHEDRGDVGVTATWKPAEQLSMEAAVKVEHSSLTGQADAPVSRSFDYTKPRAVISWSPDKDSQIRLRFEHETSQIDFGYFVAGSNFINGAITAGNAQIRPSQDWVSEVVLERKFWSTGDLSLTLRHKDLIDQIDVAPYALNDGSLIGIARNIGGGYENDLVVNLMIPFNKLGLNGGTLKTTLNWVDSQVTDPVTGLKRMPSGWESFFGEVHFAEDLPSLKLNIGGDANINGSQTIYQPFGNQHQGLWASFSLFVEYRPTSHWNFRVSASGLPGLHLHQTIDAFTGLKGLSPLLYHDDERLEMAPTLYFRVRRLLF
jgi:hypothetical protein